MNAALLDPDQDNFPTRLSATSLVGEFSTFSYSRLGTYLAAGRKMGDIWIFAKDSFTHLFRLIGHSSSVTSLW